MITKKVILCRSCHGEGSRNVLIKEGRYNDADEYERRKCLRCAGTGRLVETTEMKQEPFKELLDCGPHCS